MDEQGETKVCPDCAETVKAQAAVCRFCGHRFDGAAREVSSSASAPVPATKSGAHRGWQTSFTILVLIGCANAYLAIAHHSHVSAVVAIFCGACALFQLVWGSTRG